MALAPVAAVANDAAVEAVVLMVMLVILVSWLSGATLLSMVVLMWQSHLLVW